MPRNLTYGEQFICSKNAILFQKILAPLSVKDLLRYRSVCRSLCQLIDSSFFVNRHTTFHNNSSSSNESGSLILQASLDKFSRSPYTRVTEHALIMLSSEPQPEPEPEPQPEPESGCLWSATGPNDQGDKPQLMVFKVDNKLRGVSMVFKLVSFGFPSEYMFGHVTKKIVGSSNGLVCLYDKIVRDDEISLWNPATGRFRNLLKPEINGDCPRRLAAFGFDVETKDYKVVLLAGYRPIYYREVAPMECFCQIQVYSLSTDSWRDFQGGLTSLPGNPFECSTEGLWLNGSCFFLAHFFHTKLQRCIPDNDRFIISFDLTKEIITPIQLPDHHKDQVLYLSCVGVQLALFTVCYEPPRGTYDPEICGCEDYTIWVLDEQVSIISSSSVNKESWIKLHSFQIKHERPGEWYLPSGISNDREFAFLETRGSTVLDNNMKLYNLFTKEVEKDFLSCSRMMSRAYAYKQSLVSVYYRGNNLTGLLSRT